MYIDTHCHLFSEYYNDIGEIIRKAKEKDVSYVIVNGCDKKTNLEAMNLVKDHEAIFGAVGYHPTELDNICEKDLKLLEKQLQEDKIVALGEIGLDYHYENTDTEKQKFYFKKQLELAKKYNKPVIIHSRDAIQDTYDILKEISPVRGVLHAYSGSLEMAHNFIDLGLYLGVGGILTFNNSKKIKAVIKEIDLKYIVLETDAPYLTPEPYRKNKNEPCYIIEVAKYISNLKEVKLEEVADVTSLNAKCLFDFLP